MFNVLSIWRPKAKKEKNGGDKENENLTIMGNSKADPQRWLTDVGVDVSDVRDLIMSSCVQLHCL